LSALKNSIIRIFIFENSIKYLNSFKKILNILTLNDSNYMNLLPLLKKQPFCFTKLPGNWINWQGVVGEAEEAVRPNLSAYWAHFDCNYNCSYSLSCRFWWVSKYHLKRLHWCSACCSLTKWNPWQRFYSFACF